MNESRFAQLPRYTLTVAFEDADDLNTAIRALEIIAPADDHCATQRGYDANTVAVHLYNAVYWYSREPLGATRPSIMPKSFDNAEEENEWKQFALWLRRSADEVDRWIDYVNAGKESNDA